MYTPRLWVAIILITTNRLVLGLAVGGYDLTIPQELPLGWRSNATLPHRVEDIPQRLGMRQIEPARACSRAGWIPCTAGGSGNGSCRPPGGTCCAKTGYCDDG